MTLKKMSLKVLSVFMALIMVVGFCAPAVLAAEHEHEKKVEFTYTQEKAEELLDQLINAFLGEDTYFADYTVSEDSYYLAIGDDVAFATVLAGNLGLSEDQYSVADWDDVDADTIAKADLITISYSESKISALAADVLNGENVVIDWASIVGKDRVKYVDKTLDYIVKAIFTDKVDVDYPVELPEKETVKKTVEAYLYGYIQFAKDYTDVVQKVYTANSDATIVLLGNPNAFADRELMVECGDITIDLAKYFTAARKDKVNDYVNDFLDKIHELEEGFRGSDDDVDEVAPDYSDIEIPGGVGDSEEVVSSTLKDYINENLRDYIESFTKEDGSIDKEGLVMDIVDTHGSIGEYIEKLEEDSGYTIEEWEDTLKDEISEELENDEEFVAKVEGAIAEDVKKELEEEFGADGYTEQQYQKKLEEKLASSFTDKLNEMVKEEVDSKFEEYRDEIDAAVKVKDTYENTIKVYEEDLYNLISDLIEKAEAARGKVLDLKNTFEGGLLIDLIEKIDVDMVKDFDWAGVLGEERAENLKDLQGKLTDRILDELYKRGWIEDKEVEVPTLDLIYENLDKLDAKTREWFENFDKGDITKLLGGLIVYSDKITVWTEKGLEEFNSLYGKIENTDIVIHNANVDLAKVLSAPSSVLSLFYAGAIDNVIFVDIAGAANGLGELTGQAAIDAYAADPSIANATEEGNEYIAEKICDALGIDIGGGEDPECEHKDENHDHICDNNCGKTDIGWDQHKDSATDGNHVCDYGEGFETGCKVVLEECSDKTGDGDHKCDVCGVDGITEHTYGEADCLNPATCTECGATTGEALGHEDKNPIDHKCDRCGTVVSEHDWGDWSEWTVTREPSETEDGIRERTRTCKICGEVETETEAFLGEEDDGLPTWAIVLIVVGSVVVVGGAGFAIYWFVIRKKKIGAIKKVTKD